MSLCHWLEWCPLCVCVYLCVCLVSRGLVWVSSVVFLITLIRLAEQGAVEAKCTVNSTEPVRTLWHAHTPTHKSVSDFSFVSTEQSCIKSSLWFPHSLRQWGAVWNSREEDHQWGERDEELHRSPRLDLIPPFSKHVDSLQAILIKTNLLIE